MELRKLNDTPHGRPLAADVPTVQILFGGEPDGLSLAMITVDVPAGTAMPEHRHSGSDIIVMPIVGTVNIAQGNEVLVVDTGDAVLVTEEEAVSVSSPSDHLARPVIAAGPADFVVGISGGNQRVVGCRANFMTFVTWSHLQAVALPGIGEQVPRSPR